MTVLWEPDTHSLDSLRMALGQTLRVVDSGPTAMRAVTEDRTQDLLVVGPDIDLTAALGACETLRLERPEVGVVLMRRRLDVAVLGEALRAGVREVVAADDLGALSDACRRSQELSRRLGGATGPAQDARVITVFSAKGGCGKTTVSSNIAADLAQTGARVLLVDLDLAFGDVAISLGLGPERTMADLVSMAGHIDQEGLASVVTSHQNGLDVLCAPAHPGDADRISGALVSETLRAARRFYDVVVIDTPPAFTEHVLASFDVSDLSLVLATLDIPSVKNLRLALDTLDLLGHPQESRLVVLNRADAKTGLTIDDVSTAIHHEVDAQIPDSKDVTAATNRGVPIVLHQPRHPVSVALRAIARQRVLPGAGGPAKSAKRPTEPRVEKQKSSLFRRRTVDARSEA
ncbi:AAA family ATPase [Leekyejoonella antrihumi]|uniref:MinD/ParA family protein n=1 Tax=Leekyejoonella antrihumi TaxID=1660198 RepID=A0A563DTY9_9MICO|nr:AAA family ATPase [Leekyejoonella antrihumi]TWP33717.1 MinD/ParA family protein [Leekyejoonella antrihumi]